MPGTVDIWDIWDKNAYMIELITASVMYMSVCKKRKQYAIRAVGGAVILLAFSAVYNIFSVMRYQDPSIFSFCTGVFFWQ